jgi:hypothetical protein
VPIVARSSADKNRAVIDGWTAVHAGWGIGAGLAGLGPWWFLGLTGAYELLEYVHEHPRGSPIFGTKRPESGPNMVADVGVAALCYAVTRALRSQ